MIDEKLISRRKVVTLAAEAAAAVAVGAVTPAAAWAAEGSAAAEAAESAESTATEEAQALFTSSFTAWEGYSTTSAASLVAGATPVKAAAANTVSWSLDAESEGESASAAEVKLLALRQMGQTTYAYVAMGSALAKIDAETGTESARVDLTVSALRRAGAAFVDSVLVFPLEDGRLLAFDEDLNQAWESQVGPAAQGDGAGADALAASQVVGMDGIVYVAFSSDSAGAGADASGARTLTVMACSDYDGSALWIETYPIAASTDAGSSFATLAAPALFADASSDAILVSDGVSTLRAFQVNSEGTIENLQVTGLGDDVSRLQLAQLPALSAPARAGYSLAFAALDSAAGVARAGLLAFADSSITEALAVFETEAAGLPSGLAAFDSYLQLVTASAGGDVMAHLLAVDADTGADANAGTPAITESAAVSLPVSLPLCDTPAVSVRGTAADSATVDVLLTDASGQVARVSYDAAALGAGASMESSVLEVAARGTGSSAGDAAVDAAVDAADATASAAALLQSPASPLVNRDGTALFVAGRGSLLGEPSSLIVLAADEATAVATPVGGADGLDTMGAAFTGTSSASTGGIGAGVLIFAVGFGAYAYIRNRGGRAKRDEGLAEWRKQHPRRRRSGSGGGPDDSVADSEDDA